MKKIIVFLMLIISFNSFAQEEVLAEHYNLSEAKVAIEGYDLVSYFGENPLKGKISMQFIFQGVVYYFSNEKNKNIFKKNPNKYLPKYGGWCAYAMGERGELVDVNPETYKIIDGKLYLFYDKYFTNTLNLWNKDEIRLLKQANANWNDIIK